MSDTKPMNPMKTKSAGADSRIVSRTFFRLLPVQILLIAIGGLNSVIDGAMGGRFVGAIALTVTGLYLPIIRLVETFNSVMQGGAQILCGQSLGRHDIRRTKQVFSVDMFCVAAFGLLLTLLCLFLTGTVSALLGGTSETAGSLSQYIRGMAIGFVPQILVMQLSAFLQLEQQEKRTYIGIFCMMLLNAGLDYLFMKVIPLGMFGLGLATSLSNWVFFFFLASYYFTDKAVIRFSFSAINWKDLADVVKIGIPGALVTFCAMIRSVVLNAMLQRLSGSDGIAALSALNTLGVIFYATTSGIAAATRMLVSVYYGEEDRTGLIMIMRNVLKRGLLIVFATSAAVFCCAKPLTMLFFSDTASEAFRLTKLLLQIFPFSIPLSAFCVIFINYYQSSSRMGIVNVLSVTDGMLGVLFSAFILAPLFGTVGIWAAHIVNGIITTLIIFVYPVLQNRHLPRSMEELLTLPPDFGVPEENRLDITIHNMNEVTQTSDLVLKFCSSHTDDKRVPFYAALCLEEMAANIIQHGFRNKKRTVDVRVVYQESYLLLRIKDDCRPFNPKERMQMIEPDDVTHNIGMRMISKIADEVMYQHLLGLNVLTLKLKSHS